MNNNLEQVRQQKLANFCQIILLDLEGNVVESCNSIFDATPFMDIPVYEWFPFIESVFPTLSTLNPNQPELLYSKVEKPSAFLQGYYDFSFSKIDVEKKEHILWELFDYTTLYRDFRLYQQKRNDLEIQRQIFALENKKLRTKEEIFNRKRESQKQKYVKTSFDKGFINPMNALDMAFDAIKDLPKSKEKNKYLDSLDSISSHLQTVMDEFPEKEINLSVNQSGQEREFSLENLLYDAIPYISAEHVSIVEAGLTEELPNRLFGNPLDFKRVVVGLAINVSKYYRECSLKINLYLHDMTQDKCVVGIRVTALDGELLDPDAIDVLLRWAIVQRIVEMHQGKLELGQSGFSEYKAVCLMPFMLC